MTHDPEPLGLLLPGGGARCAYQAGALKAIAEMVPGRRNPFQVIVGQSAGAINAARLAAESAHFGRAARGLVASWSRLKVSDVIDTSPVALGGRSLLWMLMAGTGGWLVSNPRSFLDNGPLRDLLTREIDFDAIETAIAQGHLTALALSASSYAETSGQAVSFFTGAPGLTEWSRVRRLGVRSRIGVEHVLASSALPFLFPAQKIGKQYYGDGALRLTAPLSPAIRLGARRLLIIAPRDPEVRPSDPRADQTYPSLGALAGHLLDIIFNDFLENDIERMQRINATLSLMTEEQRAKTPLSPVEEFVLRPSVDLRDIARDRAASLPWAIRALLRGIGSFGGDWRLESYLNFDGAFCRDLIELGYQDARRNADALEHLLRAELSPARAEGA